MYVFAKIFLASSKKLLYGWTSFFCIRYPLTLNGEYYIPEDNDQEGAISFIQNLPIQTSPEVYGLNENADIAKNNKETLQVCIICCSC
jgi:hypothetical protein